jgi:hypothetical protein
MEIALTEDDHPSKIRAADAAGCVKLCALLRHAEQGDAFALECIGVLMTLS